MGIHIVDDDAGILTLLEELMRELNHSVRCFSSAEAYVEYMNSEEYNEPLLILTDVRMGVMTGFELVDHIRATGSTTRIVVMSGYLANHEALTQNFCHMVQKPFDIEKLLDLIAQALRCAGPCPGECVSIPAPHRIGQPVFFQAV